MLSTTQQQKNLKKTRRSTEIFFETDINKSVSRAKSEIKEIILSIKRGESSVMYGGQVTQALPCDFPRLLVEWGRKSSLDNSIRNIIVSALLSAEEKSQGSGFLAAGMWVAQCDKQVNLSSSRRCSLDKVQSCISYFGGAGFSASCASALVELGGLGHSIEYSEHAGASCLIETVDGKEIFGAVDPLFGDKAGYAHNLEKCAIVAIDGTVESVGTLHTVLSISLDLPVVVMAKKFLPDVANTMAESWMQNRARCLPICVQDWKLDNFLDLEKLKILCVSMERGDTLSAIKVEKSDCLNFFTDGQKSSVEFSGSKKRSKIVVKISKSLGGLVGLALDRVKMLMGYSRLAARSGIINWEGLCEFSSSFSDLYSKNLVIPCSSLESASRVHKSLQEILQGMGCLITV